MSVFVDTSALLAVLDADDINHKRVKEIWKDLISREESLICTNYVLIETFALVQHRLGMKAVRTFQDDIYPILMVEWVDESTHRAGITGVLTAQRKHLGLVDCVSFDVMRRLGIKSALVFNPHFKEQGFNCIP